jgi:hypothetical protein
MKTLVTTLCVLCALTNALFFADWLTRNELALAALAAGLSALCVGVACLAFRLRY